MKVDCCVRLTMDEDEDDFGDFGGFEAAEPVSPNVAQGGPAFPLEASPTPWAVLSTDNTVGVKPDLLCGQNKFPPMLDPSVPVEGTDQNNSYNLGSEIMPDFQANFDQISGAGPNKVPGLDEAKLADNILDGSFNSTTASSHSTSEKSINQSDSVTDRNDFPTQNNIPDIQDNDITADVNNCSVGVNRKTVNNDTHSDTAGIKSTVSPLQNSTELTSQTENKTAISDFKITNSLSGPEEARSNSRILSDTGDSAKKSSSKKLDIDKDDMQGKPAVGGTDGLFEDLAYIDSAAKLMRQIERDTEQKIYTDQSNVLNEELKSIRKESHQAVMAVIEEYKDLLKVNLELQKESYDQQLAKAVEEQQKLFQEKFNEQQQKFEQMLMEEKDKMEEEYKEVFNSQAEKQQEQFDLYIQEEKVKNKEEINKAVQEERENSIEMVKGILKEEKSKLDEYLQEEMSKMEMKLQKDNQKNEELMKELIESEKEKSREAIQKAVQEERLRSEETIKVLTDSIKEETIAHLEQQKQLDQVSRRRQLASLDVFLESARRQLTLLMENDSQSSNDKLLPKS